MDFQMGLLLTLTDNATSGIQNVISSLEQLQTQVTQTGTSINDLSDTFMLSSFSNIAGQLGDTFLNMGSGVVNSFKNILGAVAETGSEFENFRITLAQMYGEAGAEKQITKLLDYAKKSNYTVKDMTGMLVTFKSQGVEAFDSLSSSVKGHRQQVMDWLGDLMAFRPNEPINRWKLAIQNFLGSGEAKILRNVLDAGEITSILGHDISDTVEGRLGDLTEIVENLNLYGLQKKLSTTWSTIASNFEDAMDLIKLKIADAGVFKDLKNSMIAIYSVFTEMDDITLSKFASSVAGGLNMVTKPLVLLANLAGKALQGLIDLSSSHPFIMKVVVALTALAGAGLVVAGVVLKIMSSLSGVLLTMNLWKTVSASASEILTKGFGSILASIAPVALAIGALAILTKSNFFGMGDSVRDFTSKISGAFREVKTAISNGASGFTFWYNKVGDGTATGNFLQGLMRMGVLLKALHEIFFSVGNDHQMYTQTLHMVDRAGLRPLIDSLMTTRDRLQLFKKGFVDGFNEIMQTVVGAVDTILSKFNVNIEGTFLDSLINMLTEFFKVLASHSDKEWENFGNSVGKFAGTFLTTATTLGLLGKAFKAVKKEGSTFSTIFSGLTKVGNFLAPILLDMVSQIGSLLMTAVPKIGSVLFKMFTQAFSLVSENTFGKIASLLVNGLGGAFSSAGALLSDLGATLGAYLLIAFVEIGDSIGSLFTSALSGLSSIGEPLLGMFSEAFAPILPYIQGLFSTLGSNLLGVVGLIFAPIITYALTNWESFKSQIGEIWTTIKEQATNVWNSIKDGLKSIWDNIQNQIQPVVDAFNSMKDKLSEAFEAIANNGTVQSIISVLSSLGQFLMTQIVPVIQQVVTFIGTALQSVWGVIVSVVNGIITFISSAVQGIMSIIGGIADIITGIFTGDFSKVLDGVKGIFSGIGTIIGGALQGAVGIIKSVLSGIGSIVTSALAVVVQAIVSIATTIGSGILTVLNGAFSVITSVGSTIGSIVSSIFLGISSTIASICDSINSFFSAKWNALKANASAILQGMVSDITNKFNSMKNVFSTVMGFLSSKASSIWSSIKTAFANGVSNALSKVRGMVSKLKSIMNFKWSLPHLKVPSISISGKFSLNPPSVPKFGLSWKQVGGVFDKPSVIGVGENGEEAVMPLEKNTGWIAKLAGKITGLMSDTSDNSIVKKMMGSFNLLASSVNKGADYIPYNPNPDNSGGGNDSIGAVPVYTGDSGSTNPISTQEYITKSDSSSVINHGDDNSQVVFSEGSIVIHTDGTEKDAEKFAENIMAKIKRKKQLENMSNYRDFNDVEYMLT